MLLNIETIQQYLSSAWPGWKVSGMIGTGRFGAVYGIYRDDMGFRYESALKVLYMEKDEEHDTEAYSVTDSMIEAFVQNVSVDIKTMGALKGYPHIVSIEDYTVLKDAESCMILIRMEKLQSLPEYINRLGPLNREEVIRLGTDICRALEVCEQNDIIHGDIRPGNILFSEQGGFKLGDFGISHTIDSIYRSDTAISLGVSEYNAPELYSRQDTNAPSFHSSDLYSLGIVLYELLNDLLPPFARKEEYKALGERYLYEARLRLLNGSPLPSPRHADGRLGRVIRRACSYKPQDRFTTAREFRTALESCLQEVSEENGPFSEGDSPGSSSENNFENTFEDSFEDMFGDMFGDASGDRSEDPGLPGTSDFRFFPGDTPGGNADYRGFPDRGPSSGKGAGRDDYTVELLSNRGAGKGASAGSAFPDRDDWTKYDKKEPAERRSGAKEWEEPETEDRKDLVLKVCLAAAAAAVVLFCFIAIPRFLHPPVRYSILLVTQDNELIKEYPETGHRGDEITFTAPELDGYILKDSSSKSMILSGDAGKNRLIFAYASEEEPRTLAENTTESTEKTTDTTTGTTTFAETPTESTTRKRVEPETKVTTTTAESPAGPQTIVWEDANLEKAVRDYLGYTGNMTAEEAAEVPRLELKEAGIRDISALRHFTGLEELFLTNNRISDLSILPELKNLSRLNVEGNQVSDLSALQEMTWLQRLDLRNNQITDIRPLRKLTRLNMLDVSKNQIDDISSLRNLTSIKEIFLSYNSIRDITVLKGMKGLSYLAMGHNRIKDITPIKDLANLHELVMPNNEIEDISVLRGLIKNNTIYHLKLKDNPIRDYSPLDEYPKNKYLDYRDDK